ncbi:hypothetical protein F2Q70_00021081 [Brassica cretica]|uniref:Uncharacterized protein n=1 Tax=Brassica cretica TaxID=69181 RepID=A0A8S9GNG4_BRACR|nr:hypothetical protein F2Q70_00021081 [Brassica cretica]
MSYYHSEIPKEAVKQSIGKRYSHIFRTFREIASVAAEHIELTSCVDEDAIELLKKLEEKKKELVRANKWMPHSSEDKLVKEEEEDEDIPNVRGIKRKNPVGRPKNQHNGLHGRWKGVLEKKKHGTSKSSTKGRVKKMLSFQEPTLSPSTQLSVAVTNPTSSNGSFFTQLLQDFNKNYGDGLSKDFDKNYGHGL